MFINFLDDEEEKLELNNCFSKSANENLSKEDFTYNQRQTRFFQSIDLLFKNDTNLTELVKLDSFFSKNENFLAISARILGFLKVNNQAKAVSLIKKMVKKEIPFYIFNSEMEIWNFKKSKDYLLKILKLTQKKIENKNIFELYKFYIYANSTGSLQDEIDDKFEIRKGLIFLNKQFESNNYGRDFLHTWAPKIYEESSEFSYQNFLKRHIKKESSEDINPITILFLRNGPLNKQETRTAFKVLNKLLNEKGIYGLYLVQQVLSDDFFRNALNRNLKENKNLLQLSTLSGQRKFYHKLKKENLKIGLIHLISLGDYPEDDINEFIKNER